MADVFDGYFSFGVDPDNAASYKSATGNSLQHLPEQRLARHMYRFGEDWHRQLLQESKVSFPTPFPMRVVVIGGNSWIPRDRGDYFNLINRWELNPSYRLVICGWRKPRAWEPLREFEDLLPPWHVEIRKYGRQRRPRRPPLDEVADEFRQTREQWLFDQVTLPLLDLVCDSRGQGNPWMGTLVSGSGVPVEVYGEARMLANDTYDETCTRMRRRRVSVSSLARVHRADT